MDNPSRDPSLTLAVDCSIELFTTCPRQLLNLPCAGCKMAVSECSDEFQHVLQRQAGRLVPHGVLASIARYRATLDLND